MSKEEQAQELPNCAGCGLRHGSATAEIRCLEGNLKAVRLQAESLSEQIAVLTEEWTRPGKEAARLPSRFNSSSSSRGRSEGNK